jgi:hypothetical protein
MGRPRKIVVPEEVLDMDLERLRAEVTSLRQQVAEAPPAVMKVEVMPARQLTDSDIAPPWTVPQQACGRFDLMADGISAYCSDGTRMREFIPGQIIRNVTVGVQRTVLAIITGAADQYRMNMTNRGRIVQNVPMEFDT